MTDLTELLARVEAATGPDRELDAEIFIRVARDGDDSIVYNRQIEKVWIGRDWFDFPRYSGSVDAALALVERVLPGWWRQHFVTPEGDRRFCVSLQSHFVDKDEQKAMEKRGEKLIYTGSLRWFPTEPLATLAACLRALIAKAAP